MKPIVRIKTPMKTLIPGTRPPTDFQLTRLLSDEEAELIRQEAAIIVQKDMMANSSVPQRVITLGFQPPPLRMFPTSRLS